MLRTYRETYPEMKVHDGITYTCILAKPGMPYVLLLGENHNIECEDSSRILSQTAVMDELLKDGDHFLLEDPQQDHARIIGDQWIDPADLSRINTLRQELSHCLGAKWKEKKELYPDAETRTCKYQTENKQVQFHWLDYGLGWDNELDIKNCDSTLSDYGKDKECRECPTHASEQCQADEKCSWKDGKCIALDPTGLQVIPQGIDKHKLDSDATYRKEVTTMIQNSLVYSLLDTELRQKGSLETLPCRHLDEEDCVGYRNHEFPGGTCVFDNKGVEYQNEKVWLTAYHPNRPKKCRSMYDYIHHELRKPKCEGFQMPTPEALAEWFVSEVPDENLRWQNFHIIRRIMEVYTLLRMFRKFAQPAKRCIVYAGSNHSKALAKLLVDTQGYVILDKHDPYVATEANAKAVADADAASNAYRDHIKLTMKVAKDESLEPAVQLQRLQEMNQQSEKLSENKDRARKAAEQFSAACRLWQI